MSDLASFSVLIDRTIKREADSIVNAMGMTLPTAIEMFLRQMVKERALPFQIQVSDKETAERERIKQKRLSAKGSLRGKIRMSVDFNAPLEEMKEYME